MKTAIFKILGFVGLAVALMTPVQAQTYPDRPIKLIIGWPPGGSSDKLARAIASGLSESLKQSVVVDHRPGAGANIATAAVAKSPGDGYTLLLGGDYSHAINPSLFKNLPFNAEKDFVPITLVATYPVIIAVHPSVNARNLAELVALAKASPGKLDYATSIGTPPHLASVILKKEADIQMQYIPFSGGGPALLATIAGTTPVILGTGPSIIAQAKAGKLRVLSVTSKDRSPVLPDVPGTGEAGLPSLNISGWYGVWAPANTPQPIIQLLYTEITKTLAQPAVQRMLEAEGVVTSTSRSPAEFGEFVQSQATSLGKVIRETGMKVE